jgi:hypothetical protein
VVVLIYLGNTHAPYQQCTDNTLVASKEIGLEINANDTVWVFVDVSTIECRTKSLPKVTN